MIRGTKFIETTLDIVGKFIAVILDVIEESIVGQFIEAILNVVGTFIIAFGMVISIVSGLVIALASVIWPLL